MNARAPALVLRPRAWRLGRLALRTTFVAWTALLVWLPLLALIHRGFWRDPAAIWAAITHPDALSSLLLSLGLAFAVAVIDAVVGTAIAWALVRWSFPGRRLLASLVDLPFSVPTLVAGILVVAFLGPQSWLGGAAASAGVPIVYALPGMLLALLFVTLPFVVRAVEPVLEELDPAEEEAARTLGASDATIVAQVVLPPLLPAVVAGAGQAFARAVGEFGAMALVSGNVPGETLVTAVYVLGEVEAGDVPDGATVSVILLALSLGVQLGTARLARGLLGAS